MTIDIHVHPAFYAPINEDPAREELRHRQLDIHKNGTAPLWNTSSIRCAVRDWTGCACCRRIIPPARAVLWKMRRSESLWIWHRTSSSVLPAWIPGSCRLRKAGGCLHPPEAQGAKASPRTAPCDALRSRDGADIRHLRTVQSTHHLPRGFELGAGYPDQLLPASGL